MENKFRIAMSKKTDNELISILTIEKENYQLEAIEAAETEFKNRKLSDKEIETVNQINEKKAIIAQNKSEEPLGIEYKILLFFVPLRVFALSVYYENKGYDRKAKETVRWSYVGFAFYVLLLVFLN
jgi:hypothetical protein